MKITSITELPSDLNVLVRDSEQEGFAFINRPVSEWASNVNRFDDSGEFLLISSSDRKTSGICGVNIDPYLSDPAVARLRHLYVLPTFRSQAIGSKLVYECLDQAKLCFAFVRLRVPNVRTGRFYESLGFTAIEHVTATHSFALN